MLEERRKFKKQERQKERHEKTNPINRARTWRMRIGLSKNQAKRDEEKSVGTEDDDCAHHHHNDKRNFIERDPEIEDVCKDDSQEKSESINDDTETSDRTTCPVFTSKTSKYRTLSTLLISSKFERMKF